MVLTRSQAKKRRLDEVQRTPVQTRLEEGVRQVVFEKFLTEKTKMSVAASFEGQERESLVEKRRRAVDLLDRVCSPRGVWSSLGRYKHVCHTRDFALSIMPALPENHASIRAHLDGLFNRQKADGKLPAMYTTAEKEGPPDEKPMADETHSELLATMAALRHPETRSDPIRKMQFQDAFNYIGTISRGAPENSNGDLTRACLMHLNRGLRGGDVEENAKLFRHSFWNGRYFQDHSPEFNLLGNALAVFYGLADHEQAISICNRALENYRTPFGFKARMFVPAQTEEEQHVMDADGYVSWPWVTGFMLLAMISTGDERLCKLAETMLVEWSTLADFFEWYCISNGRGFGSTDYAPTAAMFKRVADALNV